MTKQILADPKELIFIQSRAETNYNLVDEYTAMVRRETARRIDVADVCETMSRQNSQVELG